MTITELKKEIICLIQNSTETPIQITEDTHLIRQMGLSSVETMMLISDLEDRFGISIPVSALRSVQTVGDLCRIVIDAAM